MGITIVFATSVAEEKTRFLELIDAVKLECTLFLPETLQEADTMISNNAIDVIITDTDFADGVFADWLMLWSRPCIVMAWYGQEKRLDRILLNEVSSFMMRDADFRHLSVLPFFIRKVLHTKDSLKQKNARLRISERRYMELVNAIPDIVYFLDNNGNFLYVNDAISRLGYDASELIGAHFSTILEEEDIPLVSRELVLPQLNGRATGPEGSPKLFDERRTGSRMTKNLVVRLKVKHAELKLVSTATVNSFGEISSVGMALPEYEAKPLGTVGIIRDITLHVREESRLKENLRLKETLLKEIHHRIKNNLQIVSSLLNLQGGVLEDPVAKAVFMDSQNQIQSIAVVHEKMYQSEDLKSIDTRGFIADLIDHLVRAYDIDTSLIKIGFTCTDLKLNMDQSIPLALIINELVSNAVKYGVDAKGGSIDIRLFREDSDHLRLEVQDSGTGLPKTLQIDVLNSLGLQLVKALGEQLGGKFSWSSEAGTRFCLVFPYELPGEIELF